ncbi:hypothetical protein ABZ016_23890 [Streptomyces sp. NPDC006372]|uniref:hypothetical protein n=1 Tax=Streptomyces sp. NPDC006372 TaxID=3155599 RepID=UPI0033AFCA23
MSATVTKLSPRSDEATVRIAGVVLVDLSEHVDRDTLMSFRPTVDIPPCGFPPGTNVEVHIGGARGVYEGDANLRALVAAAHACTIVVKGFDANGVIEAQRVLTRLAGMTPRPERLGCERGGCELLYGPADLEGPRR